MTVLDLPDVTTAVALPRPGEWSIEWRGKRWCESQVTGRHLSTLALLLGTDDYTSLDIDPRHGHQRLMQMIATMACIDAVDELGEVDADHVAAVMAATIAEVSEASADEILGSLRF